MLDTVFVCLYPHSQVLHHLSTLCNIQRERGILNRGGLQADQSNAGNRHIRE